MSAQVATRTDRQNRNALIASAIAAVAIGVTIPTAYEPLVRSHGWVAYANLLSGVIPTLAWVLSALLALRGRGELGVQWGLMASLIGIPLNSYWSEGIALPNALAVGVGATIVAGVCLSPAQAHRFVWAAVASAAAAIALDIVGPTPRLIPAQDTSYMYAVTLTTVFALAIFLLFQFRDYSLRTKLIIGFVALTVLAVSGVTLAGEQAIRSTLNQNVAGDLQARAQAAALAVALTFDRNIDRLQTLSLDEQLRATATLHSNAYPAMISQRETYIRSLEARWEKADPRDSLVKDVLNSTLTNTLLDFRAAFAGNEQLLITDQYGSLLASTDPQPRYNFSNERWWSAALTAGDGAYIGQPERNPGTNSYGVRIGIPVYDRGRSRVVGILHSFFTLAALQRTLDQNRYGRSGRVDLLFPSGQVLTSQGEYQTLPPDLADELGDSLATSSGTVRYLGAPRLSRQAVVGSAGIQPASFLRNSAWRTIATIEPAEALDAAETAARAAIVAGLVAILAAVSAALMLAQFLTRPIRRLTDAAEQVQAGDLNARAAVETQDEIGGLARAFNSMTARLQDTLAGLEHRVAERTRELSDANLALQSHTAYLSALSDTSTGLFQRLQLNELLHAIVERAGALVGTQHGYVFFAGPGETEIQMRVGAGLYDDLVGTRARPGAGLAGTVWQTGQPLAIDDYQKWEGRLSGARRDRLRAVVGVPLKRGEGGETVGVIGLAFAEPGRRFGDTEVEILQRFAQLASIALDNAALYANSEERLQELAALNRISSLLTSGAPLPARLGQVGYELLRIFGVDGAYIALYDEAARRVEMPFFAAEGQEFVVEPFALGPGLTSHVIQTRAPLLINHDLRAQAAALQAMSAGSDTDQSYLGVPVMLAGAVLGVIGLSHSAPDHFRDSDVRLLSTIAPEVAAAIQNARLLEQTRVALAETQRLAAREREAAAQLMALNRRLTREGWQSYLAQLDSRIVVEAAESDGGNGAGAGPGGARPAVSGVAASGNGSAADELVRVPISLRGEVIGEIELEPAGDAAALSPDHLGLVTHVAENIGVALDNARLFAETRRRVTELDALNRISQAVTAGLELETMLTVIGEQLRAIFDVQNVYIALYDPATGLIRLPYFVNDNERVNVEPIHFGEGITSHILRTRQALVINDHSLERMAALGARVLGQPARSYLGVPMLVGDDAIGVISIQSIEREGLFDESSVHLLETIAAGVGAALQNAQLYGDMQQEVQVRQRAEEEIKLSLREKEVLLKEIHHRVKNNLQIISSLLNLQSAQIKDPDTYVMFRESQARVRSMALIHEKLYQSKDLAHIDFDGYVRDLMVYLFRSYAANPDQIRTHIEPHGMYLGIDTAIPCGLIISELVTNTIKYAFPGGRRGELHVGVGPEDDGHLALRVSDTGIGLPPDLDWRETDSLGLQLVSTLAAQLHGVIQVDGSGGTSFKITFPG